MPKQSGKARRYARKKSFNKRVLEVVSGTRERKIAKQNFSTISVGQEILTSSDLIHIMPDIRPGTNDNEMLGSQILLKKLTIRGIITGDVGAGTNSGNSNWLIRNMILKQKNASGSAIMEGNADFAVNEFLENSQPYAPSASVDPNELYLTPINKNAFTSKWTQKFMLSINQNQPNWAVGTAQPRATKMFTKVLTFGKGLKLDYNIGSGSYQPNNFPYFGAIVASAPWGDETAAYDPTGHVFYKYQILAEYTDA